MKKFCRLLLLFTMLTLCFSGCSQKNDDLAVKVGSLKGPTTIGMVKMMDDAANGKCANKYEFEMATTADELLPKVISGEIDIALVPANVASVLYNKTKGGIVAVDINTLGVLYAVSQDDSIASLADLKGKTIYVTNKGTTPDYVTQYLLIQNGIDIADMNIEYKSEATEVAALLKENSEAVGILPQPFVTAACAQNEKLNVVLDLTKEWDKVETNGDSKLVTGVTIARKDFADNNKKALENFLKDHKMSTSYVEENLDDVASLVASVGIIEKEAVAKKAIPKCNITFISGQEMKKALEGYLKVLFDMDATTIGGAMPDEAFYY